ncbi:RidA family protein [Chloroflexota bacterium]
MPKEIINIPSTRDHPFSPAVRAGDYIFVSGQGGTVDVNGKELKTIEDQTKLALDNMKRIMEAADASLNDVVKVNVFLGDVNNFGKMNGVYRSYFPTNKPARSTAITGLVIPAMLVEIECIAYCPSASK